MDFFGFIEALLSFFLLNPLKDGEVRDGEKEKDDGTMDFGKLIGFATTR